jgi:hypothetical protein
MLPALQFWLTGSALFTIGSFALFAILGFAGIANMTANYRKLMIFGYVAASVLFLIGWWQTARQEEASAKRDGEYSQLQTTLGTLQAAIKRIADSVNVKPDQSVSALADKIIEKLNSQIAPLQSRHLQSSEISKMEVVARSSCPISPRVPVTAANGNQEAQMYASEFVRILKGANCDSDLDLPIPGLRPDVIGLHIGVRDMQHISAGAATLAKVLSAGGIQFDFAPIEPNFFPAAEFVLVIGAK